MRQTFIRHRVIVNDVCEVWTADLVDMPKIARWYKGTKYLLAVIDVFYKYGWLVLLKHKSGACVTEAFKNIFTEGRDPKSLCGQMREDSFTKKI